jgi:hypothetical protein
VGSSRTVAWSDVSEGRRTCVFCGGPANSVEHIFKQAFKKKLGVSDPVDRAFSKVDATGWPACVSTIRPDPLFEAKVRRVCRKCNSGWMNRLDRDVEAWIVDTDNRNAWQACDPTIFRRWALKLALMRSLLDNATIVPRDYFHRLFNGDDLEEWHIFVGRAHFKEFRHAFVTFGIGWDEMSHSLGYGIIHASWALGAAVVSAVCIHGGGPDREQQFLPSFRNYNRNEGEPLVEIPFGAAALPDVFAHRKLAPFQTRPFFMFFTPEPVSPVAGEMRKAHELVSGAHDLSSAPPVQPHAAAPDGGTELRSALPH